MASPKALWQHHAMINFRTLPDDHPDLAHSPMLREAALTLKYAQEHGSIGLSKTKSFKRTFIAWLADSHCRTIWISDVEIPWLLALAISLRTAWFV